MADQQQYHEAAQAGGDQQPQRTADPATPANEFAEDLHGGEPRSGDHGGGQRRGYGYGGRAQFGDTSYGTPGYQPQPFDGVFGSHGGLYDGPPPDETHAAPDPDAPPPAVADET